MSQWDFIMGKRLRLCHYYAVTQIQSTGNHQGLEQPVIMSNIQGVSQKKKRERERERESMKTCT